MADIDIHRFKQLYFETARKYIHDLQTNLPLFFDENKRAEAIDACHIAAHSLKSQSLIMGYQVTGYFCGTLEYVFRDMKEGTKIMTSEDVQLLQQAVGLVAASIEALYKTDHELDLHEEQGKLEERFEVKFVPR